MYDQDYRGAFLHFYTETVGGVTFEAVEWRDGYDEYGAGNVPVRLAAQPAGRAYLTRTTWC